MKSCKLEKAHTPEDTDHELELSATFVSNVGLEDQAETENQEYDSFESCVLHQVQLSLR